MRLVPGRAFRLSGHPSPRLDDEYLVTGVRYRVSQRRRGPEASDERPFILHPGEFVLGSTAERVAIPADLVGRIEGKSSLGRLGLLIHTTAGFVDAGQFLGDAR